MAEYLNIYDHNRQKVAVLENAHNIVESESLNAVGTLTFDLPISDPKVELCRTFYYAQYADGQMYRIMTPVRKRAETGTYSYSCEHVITTLIDDVIFGSMTCGGNGLNTRGVIERVLAKQIEKRWVLKDCDFDLMYEYGWENENLLNALFSIPNLFVKPYMWVYDTSVFPWRISLKLIDEDRDPQFYVRAGKNMLTSDAQTDNMEICTRLYLLGYGEGVNQLTVSKINGGKPYIESIPQIMNLYGGKPISRILVDRRFEDAESLLAFGRAQLRVLQFPTQRVTVQAADLYKITQADYDKAEIGRIIMLVQDGVKSYIVGISRNHDTPGDMSLTIANTPSDIANSIADLADRQRIESVYAQGATQIYAQSIQANATKDKGAVINFYIPQDMRIINWVIAKIKISKFRTYSKATKGGGAVKKTSSDGGATKKTSSSGGGSTQTSSSGGGSTQTSSGGGGAQTTTGSDGASTQTSSSGGGASKTTTQHKMKGVTQYSETGKFADNTSAAGGKYKIDYPSVDVTGTSDGSGKHTHGMSHTHPIEGGSHTHQVPLPTHYHDLTFVHDHSVEIPAHTHSVGTPAHSHTINLTEHTHTVEVPAHTHSTNIPNHTHDIELPNHTHEITIPEHAHEIEHGIFEFGNPTKADLYVGSKKEPVVTIDKSDEIDLTEYLLNDDKMIPRGTWLSVEVRPDDLAYITIDLTIKGFCQSRGDRTH